MKPMAKGDVGLRISSSRDSQLLPMMAAIQPLLNQFPKASVESSPYIEQQVLNHSAHNRISQSPNRKMHNSARE
jgi:hypothetical protein